VEPPAAANEMIITLHSEEVIAMMSPTGRVRQDAASRHWSTTFFTHPGIGIVRVSCLSLQIDNRPVFFTLLNMAEI